MSTTGSKRYHDAKGRPVVLANVSRYHPDFGMTTAAHEGNKAGRAAGTVKFVDKETLRARRGGLARRMGL